MATAYTFVTLWRENVPEESDVSEWVANGDLLTYPTLAAAVLDSQTYWRDTAVAYYTVDVEAHRVPGLAVSHD